MSEIACSWSVPYRRSQREEVRQWEAEELGRRLRAARDARGLSQQAVADALGLARTAITQMEAGNRSVSTLELAKLAGLYLQPVSSFFQESRRDEDEDVLAALYRVAPGLESDPATHEQVARCVSLCREGVALERFLGSKPRSGPPSYEVRLPRSSWEAVAQGRADRGGGAPTPRNRQRPDRRRLRAHRFAGGYGPRASGCPTRCRGCSCATPSIGFAILVNSSHPRGRKRFSYAHEYAHALLDRRPQHRDLEYRQLVGIGRTARKRVRSSVSHAEERRLRGVAASRQGASQPPGTDHLRCRERWPHRRGVSLSGAFATDQLQGTSRCSRTDSE